MDCFIIIIIIIIIVFIEGSRDSSFYIATCFGLNGPGTESRMEEIFRTRPDRPWGPPSILYDYCGYRVFSRAKAAGSCL